jgi:hypothetical protein
MHEGRRRRVERLSRSLEKLSGRDLQILARAAELMNAIAKTA